ncbi:phospho-sugar mutase [Eubacteriales bacterium KG127]
MENKDINQIQSEFNRWIDKTKNSIEDQINLTNLLEDDRELYDSFNSEIRFGTSGLRGIMGIGPNRMNKYVVSRATRGLGSYINRTFAVENKKPKVIISYDTRNNSKEFAIITARVLIDMDIEAVMFSEATPVPVLSYAIRELNSDMGVIITASHNPKIYNGYKVYNNQGHQIVGEEAQEIMSEIQNWDYFDLPKDIREPQTILPNIKCRYLDNTIEFIKKLHSNMESSANGDLKVVYTPLNGSGRDFVLDGLNNRGFNQVILVPSQEMPDGNFPTCPVPNPEKIAAYNEAFYTLDKEKGDLIIATDPDSDRVGVALYFDGVKKILTGNQIGILLFDYLCGRMEAIGETLKEKIAMRSLVSTALFDKIAESHGISVIKTLTGFKHMGKLMCDMEKAGNIDDFFFAFEESNGFLFNPVVRDKDGVASTILIAEMASYYKSVGKTLNQRLMEIYDQYGHYSDKTENYIFTGVEGKDIMDGIMEYFRIQIKGFLGGIEILNKIDYLTIDSELKEDIIEFELRDNGTFIIRPSGTEPKIKVYFFGNRDTRRLESEVGNIIDKFRNS